MRVAATTVTPDMGPILVTGGGGYIGSSLVSRLFRMGHEVRILDAFFFGDEASELARKKSVSVIRGDIRDLDVVSEALKDVVAIVHLAAVANDPSFDLDPSLGRSINLDALEPLMSLAKARGVQRFVYASSASVYGVSARPTVDESHPLRPLTDYSRYKAAGERILGSLADGSFLTVAVRAATVCGVSLRQRLDLTVNMLTAQAVERKVVTVFGGEQYRPNVHINDLVDVYIRLLTGPETLSISGRALNVGCENLQVAEIARVVGEEVEDLIDEPVKIEIADSPDQRSYRLTSSRLRRALAIHPQGSVRGAAREVASAIISGRLSRALDDDRYYNVRRMATLPPDILWPQAATRWTSDRTIQ